MCISVVLRVTLGTILSLCTRRQSCSRRFGCNLSAVNRSRAKEYTRELPGDSKDGQGSDGNDLHIHDVRVPGVGPAHLRGVEKCIKILWFSGKRK